jgi:hypothetical protein
MRLRTQSCMYIRSCTYILIRVKHTKKKKKKPKKMLRHSYMVKSCISIEQRHNSLVCTSYHPGPLEQRPYTHAYTYKHRHTQSNKVTIVLCARVGRTYTRAHTYKYRHTQSNKVTIVLCARVIIQGCWSNTGKHMKRR